MREKIKIKNLAFYRVASTVVLEMQNKFFFKIYGSNFTS